MDGKCLKYWASINLNYSIKQGGNRQDAHFYSPEIKVVDCDCLLWDAPAGGH
jgi:hypothetical protein